MHKQAYDPRSRRHRGSSVECWGHCSGSQVVTPAHISWSSDPSQCLTNWLSTMSISNKHQQKISYPKITICKQDCASYSLRLCRFTTFSRIFEHVQCRCNVTVVLHDKFSVSSHCTVQSYKQFCYTNKPPLAYTESIFGTYFHLFKNREPLLAADYKKNIGIRTVSADSTCAKRCMQILYTKCDVTYHIRSVFILGISQTLVSCDLYKTTNRPLLQCLRKLHVSPLRYLSTELRCR